MVFPLYLWVGFHIFVFAMLALDLGVLHRKPHAVKFREAILWSMIWILFALLFNLGLYAAYGEKVALEFLTGYLIEKSLSVDNIFVFLMIFSYFKTPSQYHHRILFFGILGALLMRAAFIWAGIGLIRHFHGVIYFFGGLLIFTGIKMIFRKDETPDLADSLLIRTVRKIIPVTPRLEEGRFFVHKSGRLHATPLLLVLLLIEATDVVFAIDSIPAVLAVTSTSFIVYTSNVFAILGLRSLYFALAGFLSLFSYLHYGLAAILIFVGCKMLASDFYEMPIWVTLGFIFVALLIAILFSLKLRPMPPKK